MNLLPVFTALAIGLTLAYAVLNGFRDASTAVAAAVRTRALRPGVAVLVAALFAFLGTISTSGLSMVLVGQLDLNLPDGVNGLMVLICGLLAAGGWALLCWWRGLPISSTQALISAIVGAGGAAAFTSGTPLKDSWTLLLGSVLIPMVFTPIVAYAVSYFLVIPATWLMRHDTAGDVNNRSRVGQSIAACAVALGLGLQDGQRTGAMIALVLITGHVMDPGPLTWAIQLTAGAALGIGVLLGGWRITYTMARRLVNFDPLRGMVAQGVAAVLLYVGSLVLHLPLSTTQSVTSAIVGAGSNQAFESVFWRNVSKVALHWILTPVICIVAGAILALASHPLVKS